MTNSIATAKCPSALTSGNYGMSQNRYTDESKEYIFVKLTDSAYRAIEEYQHNENTKRFTNGQRPKIQVNGNSGVIYFPTLDSNEGRKFGFTIDDVEGSLECIQQTAEGLDVLGSLPYRMRIHANDDIYDTTRTKMAIAEETEKSKCIREIKPNQTDIGRKVKKSITSSAVPQHLGHSGTSSSGNNNNSSSSSSNYLSSLSRNKLVTSLNSNSPPTTQHSLNSKVGGGGGSSSSSSRSPNPTLLGGAGTISSSGNSRYGNSSSSSSNIYAQSNVSPSLPSLTSASSLSSTLAGGIVNGYASAAHHNSPPDSATGALASSIGGSSKQSRLGNNAAAGGNGGSFSRGGGGNGGSYSGSGSKASSGGTKGGGGASNSGGGKLPDISRRKIRERLIHLLALRPFKKPELYSRLQNEGLRDRERSLISNILKDIATLSRDNTYNLRRQMWNDVNENWPYYTEQELQQLKRRKPQNLTPPLSSDAGSSTSGQSPTSTHTGSPPPMAGGSGLNGGNSLKRTSLEYDEQFTSTGQPKKQRISHFKKDAIAAVNTVTAGSTNSGGGSGGGNVPRGPSHGALSGSNSNSGGNISYPLQRSKYAPSATTLSPQGARNAGHVDEQPGNTADLSYNVLNNMDDFMLNMEQQQSSSYLTHGSGSVGNARKSNGSGNSKSAGSNPKENRHAGGSSSASNAGTTNFTPKTSTNNYNVQENEGGGSNMKHALKRGALTGSPKSTLPYGVNFVPESSSSSRAGSREASSGSGSNRNGGSGNYRHQSPSCMQQQQQQQHQQQQQQQKSSNSVIYSPKMHASSGAANEREDNMPAARSGSSRSQAMSRSTAATGSNKQPRASDVRTATPPVPEQQQQRHLLQQAPPPPHYQSQQSHSASTHSPVQRHNNHPHYTQQQQLQQQQQQQQQQQPPAQLQRAAQHAAINADAVETDVSAAETPNYDFSNYTAITSIEQRRQYKTEFERDYDEYRQLLERIEDVRRNFQVLADQLQRAPQGCSDYEHIKEQIVAEYERINNEEELKRDKQRFDYLHAKLAHIKQLVTDYDKTLTSMAAAAAAAAQQQQQQQQQEQVQHQQQQQQQQQKQQHVATTAAMHMAADATTHLVDGSSSSNVLAAATAHSARVSPMVSGSESNHSPPGGYQQQTQHYMQQQQQLQPSFNTPQQDQYPHRDEILHRKKKHAHSNVQQHNQQQQPQQQQQQQQQQYLSPHNQAPTMPPASGQYSLQHQQQHQEHFINGHHQHMPAHAHIDDEKNIARHQQRHNNNDTDSDDSSDSNDDDSNDDDTNDEDDNDDDNCTDSNSNDDDDDEDNAHARY